MNRAPEDDIDRVLYIMSGALAIETSAAVRGKKIH
jgi:hypothetical protein